jgi:hypothetical protein
VNGRDWIEGHGVRYLFILTVHFKMNSLWFLSWDEWFLAMCIWSRIGLEFGSNARVHKNFCFRIGVTFTNLFCLEVSGKFEMVNGGWQ